MATHTTAVLGIRKLNEVRALVEDGAIDAAASLLRSGCPREALNALNGTERISAEGLRLRGQALAEMGRDHEAAGAYFSATLLDSHNLDARLRLAACVQRLGLWNIALQHFEQARSLDPNSEAALLGIGSCLLRLARPLEALPAFDAAIAAMTDPSRALLGKAVALQMVERDDEAEILYLEVLRLRPETEDALGNLVALYMKRDRHSSARQYATCLLAFSPNSRIAIEALAACALADANYEEAARHCARLVEIVPHSVEAWTNLRFASQRVLSALQGETARHKSAASSL